MMKPIAAVVLTAALVLANYNSALAQGGSNGTSTSTWTGVSREGSGACNDLVVLMQTGELVTGTWSSEGPVGRCKRYIRGTYNPDRDEIVLRDIGLDYGTSDTCLISRYELHLVDEGKKIVGTYLSRNGNGWFSLDRQSAVPPAYSSDPQNNASPMVTSTPFSKLRSLPSRFAKGLLGPSVGNLLPGSSAYSYTVPQYAAPPMPILMPPPAAPQAIPPSFANLPGPAAAPMYYQAPAPLNIPGPPSSMSVYGPGRLPTYINY